MDLKLILVIALSLVVVASAAPAESKDEKGILGRS